VTAAPEGGDALQLMEAILDGWGGVSNDVETPPFQEIDRGQEHPWIAVKGR